MTQRVAYWIAALCFSVLVLAKFDSTTGFTRLLRFGEHWELRRHPLLAGLPVATARDSGGYDGQFYAQIALDPFLRNPDTAGALDAPDYRARRILVPLVSYCLGWGAPWRVLNAFALVNVACWFVLSWQMRRLIGGTDWAAFAKWFGCLFSMGALESVRQSLVDLPALVLLLFALGAESRPTRAAIWLGLANLAKETSAMGAGALLWTGRWRPLLTPGWKKILLISLTPLLCWSLYVAHRFAAHPSATGSGNLTWPFIGLIRHVATSATKLMQGDPDSRHAWGLIAALGLLLQAILLWRWRSLESALWRTGVATSVLLFLIGPWVWTGYWAACRALLPMTVAFNVGLPSSHPRWFWPAWILGNATILHAVWRFL